LGHEFSGSRDDIGHVDHSIPYGPFPIGGPLEPSLYLYRFPGYSVANATHCWHDLKPPICKGRGHSFWYQSVPHIRFPV